MSNLTSALTVCWYIVEICLGVGFVIFVHELGHFAVAKLCGVKCEKFYLGFDIGGWKICRFRWGETEYGIGILPLGGYVKMLGQEDNPAKLKEEIERAKLQKSEPGPKDTDPKQENAPADFDVAEAEQALYDPRSYLAKSVPKRMAIIAAGVIMNVIFGFLMAVVAYSMGVSQPTCVIGGTFSGEAGWRAGLRTGDQILEIAGKKVNRFKDLQKNITLGDATNGIPLLIKRPGQDEPFTVVVNPDQIRKLPSVGLEALGTTKFVNSDMVDEPYAPHSAAARAKPALNFDDRITMINGEKIDNFLQLESYLQNNPEKTLQMTTEVVVSGENNAPSVAKLVEVTVPPQPMRTLGLVMEMGEISAIQKDSPASQAGIQASDKILSLDGKPIGDPMRLPAELRRRTGETIKLSISRKDSPQPLEIPVTLRNADWIERSIMDNSPIAIPQLGLAYRVLNTVAEVLPGSPAEKAGIQPGTTLKAAVVKEKANKKDKDIFDIKFGDKDNWPVFFTAIQTENPDVRVELTDDKDKTYELPLADAEGWFNPDRGFRLASETFFQKADGIGNAVRLGAEETWEQMTMVVQIMRGMGSGRISPTNLGGPGTIFWVAYLSAKHGFASLLLFLTMLSANLAVLNVLPIPMLDGGHLVFLSYEGIRGKPADERIQIVLSVIGLILLMALMIFVCGLDINRFLFK